MAKTIKEKIKAKQKFAREQSAKQQLSFTLSKGLKNRFLEHCEAKQLNKSQVLEKMIADYFESIDFAGMEKRI